MNIDIKNSLTNIIENKNFNRIIMIISLIVFAALSLYKVINHVPFFDEINAWNIAQNFKPWEILEITKHEGHLFIWYYLLMPFAQHDIGYPIAMKLINWAFCFGAILLLWLKSPFNSITKVFITFSLPVQILYIHARCYSIGIFLLFLVCLLYKNRLKHPFLYATLLILAGNTSVMALFLAFPLGLCFLYDLYDGLKRNILSKKDLYMILSIFILGSMFILAQFHGFTTPYYAQIKVPLTKEFYDLLISNNTVLKIILVICHLGMFAFAWDFFEKNKHPFWVLALSSYLYMILFCGIYRAAYWHFIFLFVNIIIALWIYLSEYNITQNFQKTYLNLFCIIFIILTLSSINYEFFYGQHIKLALDIQTNNIMRNKKIFFFPTDSSFIGITHDIKNMGIKYYDCLGDPLNSKEFYIHQWDNPEIDFEKISLLLKKNEIAYAFVESTRPYYNYYRKFNFSKHNYTKHHSDLEIKLIDQNKYDLIIWQIKKLK